jgi:hypothetical protein
VENSIYEGIVENNGDLDGEQLREGWYLNDTKRKKQSSQKFNRESEQVEDPLKNNYNMWDRLEDTFLRSPTGPLTQSRNFIDTRASTKPPFQLRKYY